jgi:hypothetical protein
MYAFGQNKNDGFWIALPSNFNDWSGSGWNRYYGLKMSNTAPYTMSFEKMEKIDTIPNN